MMTLCSPCDSISGAIFRFVLILMHLIPGMCMIDKGHVPPSKLGVTNEDIKVELSFKQYKLIVSWQENYLGQREEVKYRAFNTKLNPTEREDGSCDDIEACSSVFNLETFEPIQKELIVLYHNYMSELLTSEDYEKNTISRSLVDTTTSYDVLSLFYHSSNGAEWDNKQNWMNTDTPCPLGDWYGVTCSLTNILAIQLGTNNLRGSLPSQLGLLSLISSFSIQSNSITGSIASQFGLMTTMKSNLNLASNQFSGSLPSEFGQMVQLTSYFSIALNSFSGPLPSQIGQLVKLTSNLYLNSNLFCDEVPSQVSSLLDSFTNYDIISNNSFGTPCCESLSSVFTCTPTFTPTFTPTSITSQALIKFYQSTNGADWGNNLNWINSGDPCPYGAWQGVTCVETDVVALTLNINNLKGSLPSQLGLLSMITAFAMRQNSLSGSLPSQFGQLTAMSQRLRLNSNSLNGKLPSQLGQLSLIDDLSIQDNDFIGSLPSQLGQINKISSSFDISKNKFNGLLPSQIGQFHLLASKFIISSNQFTGSLPSQLGQMISVNAQFLLDNNTFTGRFPSEIGRLTSLEKNFLISSNYFSAYLPSQLGQLTKVSESFSVAANQFCGEIPSQVSALSSQVNSIFDLFTDNSFGTLCCESSSSVFTCSPTTLPTSIPSLIPSFSPTYSPTAVPTPLPSPLPTMKPTSVPSLSPSILPSPGPTPSPSPLPTPFPTPVPSSHPSPLPTKLPSSSPTPLPSPLPTMKPTSVPSLSPSILPSPGPTSSPSSLPTPFPTPVPSSHPSPLPSALPTGLPFPVPTLVPTSHPTQTPTLFCGAGNYLNSDGSCIECAIGYYSDIDTLPFATGCIFCPAGKYNSQSGQPICSDCATGKLSSGDRSYCKDCEAGEYSYNNTACIECEVGKYAPQALSGSCLHCAAGSHTNNATKATTCSSCNAGTYSNGSSVTCTSCSKGTYSAGGAASCIDCDVGFIAAKISSSTCVACPPGRVASYQSSSNCSSCPIGSYQGSTGQRSCIDCDAGKYAPGVESTSCTLCTAGTSSSGGASECTVCPRGQSSPNAAESCVNCTLGLYAWHEASSVCTACPAGTFSPNTGSYNCSACPEGKYQGSTGQINCVLCAAGSYAASSKTTSCSSCESNFNSVAGSKSCNLAATNYYLSGYDSSPCPQHATCLGNYYTPIPNNGYWVDHSDLKYAATLYKCARSTCKGGNSNSTCWTINQYNQTRCQLGEIQCQEGAEGPLCGSCVIDYIYSGVKNACIKCQSSQIQTFILFAIFCIIGILIALYFKFRDSYLLNQVSLVQILLSLDSGSLKVMWVTYQIIASVTVTLDVQYPSPFSDMMSLMSLFSLDFIALECFNDQKENAYFDVVKLWCIFPIILGIIILIIALVRLVLISSSSSSSSSKNNEMILKIKSQHIWFFLFLSYLVLPPVTNKQLQVYDCITIESGSFLRANTSINCNSNDYLSFHLMISLFVAIYQLIPILWLVLLYRKREILNPMNCGDEKLAQFTRNNNLELAHLRFLFIDYKCNKWWFEIADMYRRILFIGILPLISPRSSMKSSFGCILSIMSVAYFREEQPYCVEFTNVIAHIAQFSILTTFYCALSIESDAMVRFGLHGQNLGVFLIIINLIVIVLTLRYAWICYRKQLRQQLEKEAKALKSEDARGFSSVKFKTTFDYVCRQNVPSSHALVFYYTTIEHAKLCRKSGIPSHAFFDGIPFTLRSPHETIHSDVMIFNTENQKNKAVEFPNEEVLAISLPIKFLNPLRGYENDICLCMISSKILHALRPTIFNAILYPQPWIDNILLLSPHCILRSYQIMDSVSNSLSRMQSSIKLSNEKMEQNKITSVTFESVQDVALKKDLIDKIVDIRSVVSYGIAMRSIRKEVLDLVPLYHYTSVRSAGFILKTGFRMSTQGQGDGGVYVSTQGPASYGLGTDDYEINIIKDCFGVERIDEYYGKGLLEVVIIYGCEASVLEQTPGGRENAKMFSKSTFRCFSLPHSDGNHFLRPDRILGVFKVNPNICLIEKEQEEEELAIGFLEEEKHLDISSLEKLYSAQEMHHDNSTRIGNALQLIAKPFQRNTTLTNNQNEETSENILDEIRHSINPLKRLSVIPFFRKQGRNSKEEELPSSELLHRFSQEPISSSALDLAIGIELLESGVD